MVLLSSALDKLPRKRTNVVERLLRVTTDEEPILQTYVCNVARTAGVIELKHGKRISRLSYAAAGKVVLVDVIFNDQQTLHSTLSIQDVEAFSRTILNAFGGHSDYARVVLTSMRDAVDTAFFKP